MNNSRIEGCIYRKVLSIKVIIGKNAKVGYGEDYTINRESQTLLWY